MTDTEQTRQHLTRLMRNAEWSAQHDIDCTCEGYSTTRMVKDEIRRPAFHQNPEYEQEHSDAFKTAIRGCFTFASTVLSVRDLLERLEATHNK
jgi:hypothetical protein